MKLIQILDGFIITVVVTFVVMDLWHSRYTAAITGALFLVIFILTMRRKHEEMQRRFDAQDQS